MQDDLKKPRNGQQLKIRLPEELYEWVKKIAQENDRSMCYVINHAVKKFQQMEQGNSLSTNNAN